MPSRGPYETSPPVDHPRTLGERIKSVRMNWHWTQAELGAALNTDQTAVSGWERERTTPSGPTLAALASLFQSTPEVLLSGRGFTIPIAPAVPGVPPSTRMVELRDPGQASALFLDLKNDETLALVDPQDVMLRLIQATRDGRAVWVVVE